MVAPGRRTGRTFDLRLRGLLDTSGPGDGDADRRGTDIVDDDEHAVDHDDTPSTTTTTATSTPACTASDLQLISEGTNGAAGTIVATFGLRNATSTPCHTYGYPGVLFLDKTGAALPTDAQRTTHDMLGTTPVAAIVIEPGKLASFRIVASLIGSGAQCRTASGLQAIAPDDTATMRTTIPGGLFECTKVTLSPLSLGSGIPQGT